MPPKKKCHQRGIILHRGRGSTAHAQTSPCYSIGAFIKCASKSLFATKKCHQSPFCHQKMPPEPFLPPKNATRALSATKKCHQRGILIHRGEGVYCACADFPMLQHRSFHQMCIRAFLPPKNATRALSATKKCHQSPFCPQKCHQSPFCHQKMPPERNSPT